MWIIECVKLWILPVNRQCILCEVIGTYAEEINFFCKFTAHHNSRRCLDHNSKFHILTECDSFFAKFFLYFFYNLFNFLHFPHCCNHREHDRNLTKCRCTIQCTQLSFKNLRLSQTNTDCTISKCRILFFI